MEPIKEFQGEYRWLSNFWFASVVLDGFRYSTVENAFQAAKTLDDKERLFFRQNSSPVDAKRQGRKVTLRSDWNSVRIDIMRGLLKQKFAYGTELAKKLVATAPRELIEGNTWNDKFWGVCNGIGENHLGKLLMEIRNELIK